MGMGRWGLRDSSGMMNCLDGAIKHMVYTCVTMTTVVGYRTPTCQVLVKALPNYLQPVCPLYQSPQPIHKPRRRSTINDDVVERQRHV